MGGGLPKRPTFILKIKLLQRAMGAVTAQLHGSFVARTIPEWNRLPAAAADAVSPTLFHSRLNAIPANFWPCSL